MDALNQTQVQLFKAVDSFIAENGYSPTVRELGAQLDMSPAGIFQNLRKLRTAGLVTWIDGTPRTLRVLK